MSSYEGINGTDSTAVGSWKPSDTYIRLENALFILQIILSITGIAGNALVCITIVRAKFMHNVTNFLIAHMAMADILVCASLLIFQERYIQDFARTGTVLRKVMVCKLFRAKLTVWLTCDLSILSMLCVTVERYVAIVHPLKYPCLLTKARLGIMMVSVWCLSFAAQIPIIISSSFDVARNECYPDATSHNSAAFFVILGIFSFLGPVFTLFWCYCKIVISLRKSAQHQQRDNNHAPANELLLARRRVIKVLLIVSLLYFLIWLPVHVLLSIVTFHKKLSLEALSILILLEPTVAVVNSVVNPFVYAFKYKEFQHGVRNHVFAFWFRRRRRVADFNTPQRANDIATVMT